MSAVARTIEQVRDMAGQARHGGRRIGLVPTMGALHQGHASLMRAARAQAEFVVVSIFVNPTQFGPGEDFTRYPRDLEQDVNYCRSEGVDVVFAPEANTIYPQGFRTFVEVQEFQSILCGRSRPGHFRGVATVVLKLLNIVQPDTAYFGQKDFQQFRIIQQLVHDLNLPVQVSCCPIVREADGLALSSRNRYLNAEQRRHAVVLYNTLQYAKGQLAQGQHDATKLKADMIERIGGTPGAELDYAEILDADTLNPLSALNGDILFALAVKFASTRLIDNEIMRVQEAPS